MVHLILSFNTPRGIFIHSDGTAQSRKSSTVTVITPSDLVSDIVRQNSLIPSFMYSDIIYG